MVIDCPKCGFPCEFNDKEISWTCTNGRCENSQTAFIPPIKSCSEILDEYITGAINRELKIAKAR